MFKTLSFIGSGNLATAMFQGLKTSTYKLRIASPNVFERHQENEHTRCFTNNHEAICGSDCIILAVKPHQIITALEELKGSINSKQVIISLAAGISLSQITKILPDHRPIFRVMPNIAMSIKQSATAIFTQCDCKRSTENVDKLFREVGITEWLSQEKHIDISTVIAGSSPAFFYYFMQSLLEAGVDAGLSHEQADKLIKQAGLGAIMLSNTTTDSLNVLIDKVTSKKGTTEAGLSVFTSQEFKGIVKQSFAGALARAKELNIESK